MSVVFTLQAYHMDNDTFYNRCSWPAIKVSGTVYIEVNRWLVALFDYAVHIDNDVVSLIIATVPDL